MTTKLETDRPEDAGGTAPPREAQAEMPVASRRDAATRSFVLQLAPGSDPGARQLSGRVQHLATTDGGNFESIEALCAILQRVLGRRET